LIVTREAKKITHLLIIRLSAMGDVAMSVPVVDALRRACPELKITILTRTFFRPFFRDVDGVEFLEFDPKGRHKGLRGLFRLAGDAKRAGIDAVADIHDVLRTKVVRTILRWHGMKTAVIDKGRRAKKELTRRSRKVFAPLTTTIERYYVTILRLGLRFYMPSGMERKRFPMPPAIASLAGPKQGVWVGVAPFAKHKGKIYPIPLADELIGLLSSTYDKVFIFGGGSHEQSFAEGMETRHRGVVSVIGRVDLSAEMDVISNLDAIVSMDSSAMHMASLVGTPAISVWGATHPFAGFYAFGQDPADAVQLDLPCRPCSVYGNKPCIFGDYCCLANIPPSTIADAVARRIAK
jgi:ADP-heptose:LPS heptosyltransferase